MEMCLKMFLEMLKHLLCRDYICNKVESLIHVEQKKEQVNREKMECPMKKKNTKIKLMASRLKVYI